MTKKKFSVCVAAIAAFTAILAGAFGYAFAEKRAASSYEIEENYAVGSETGVKITLQAKNNAASFDYWNYIDVAGQDEIVNIKMIPADNGTAEAGTAVITITDAIDETRSLSVIIATGGRWYDCKATYVTASFGSGFTAGQYNATDSFGVNTIGDRTLVGNGYGAEGYMDIAGWKGDYYGFFAGTETRPISTARFTLSDGKLNVYTDYNAGHNRKTIADVYSDGFLSYYRGKYSGLDQPAEAAKYTEEYARNLFPSGKAKLNVSFARTTGKTVSFAVTSAGGRGTSEVSDDTAPVIDVNLTTKGVKNYPFALPEITAIDNFDGKITDFDITVTDPDGNPVTIENGVFTPALSGDYTLSVRATDAAGNEGRTTAVIGIVESVPEAVWSGGEVRIKPSYYVHEKITVPATTACSSLSLADGGSIPVYAELVRNGETAVRERAENGAVLTVSRSGNYIFRYVAIDGAGAEHALEKGGFSATDRPVILEEEEQICQVGYPYEIEKKLCLYLDGKYPTGYTVFDDSGNRIFVADGTFTPDREGTYFVRYFATVDGISVERVLKLNCIKTGWAMLDGEKFTAESGFSLPSYATDKGSGLLLATNESNAFSLKNKLDLTSLSPTDNVIRFTPLWSEKLGYGGASAYSVVLTDAYDPNNKVTVRIFAHGGFTKYAYVTLNYDGRGLARYSEYGGKVYDWDNFGCLVTSGMGRAAIGNPFYIQYDNAEKAFYIDCHGSRYQLLDLDDGEQVGYGREWTGFTTGEVSVEVNIECLKPSAVVVTELGGQSLGGKKLDDTVAPKMKISAPERFASDGPRMPDGEVNKFYPLPSFSAYDLVSGKCDVAISLIRIGENATLTVKDGGFVPDKAGEYRYAASAKDEAGNVTSVAYNFTVSEVLESIALSLADYDETIVKAGSRFVIPSIGASGGSGEKTISFTASLNGEPLYPDDLNRVYLHDRGELKITATAIDYLSTTVTEELVINVLAESSPVIEVTGVPYASFTGVPVILPDFTATDYAKNVGDAARFPDRFVTIDGKLIYSVKGDVTDGSLTVNGLTVGKHIVRYCAGSPDAETAGKSFEITVVPASSLKDFFIPYDYDESCSDSTVVSSADGYGVLNVSTGNKGFSFVNPVSAYGFGATFSGLSEAGGQSATEIVLSDLIDPEISVRLSFTTDDKKTYLRINRGGKAIGFVGSIRDVDKYIEFGFDSATNYITSASGSGLVRIERCENGAIFRGFPSGSVNVSFELIGVGSGGGSVNVFRLGNQIFNGSQEFADLVGPQIGYNGAVASCNVSVGSSITLPAAYARDVITGKAEVLVTVKRGSRVLSGFESVTANVPHVLAFDRYGYYTVTYTATDLGGKTTKNTYTFNCKDDVPPELTVDGNIPGTAKTGSEITLPEATATDNYSDVTLTVYVTAPDGSTTKITNGKIVFSLAGKYRITYFATDDDYNSSSKTFVTEVRK